MLGFGCCLCVFWLFRCAGSWLVVCLVAVSCLPVVSCLRLMICLLVICGGYVVCC